MLYRLALLMMCAGLWTGCEGDLSSDSRSVATGVFTDEDNPQKMQAGAAAVAAYNQACEGILCEDENPCTTDTCIGGKCIFQGEKDAPCDDGNACTAEDACTAEGECLGPVATECDDDNSCTIDTCDPLKGCVFAGLVDGSNCNDGDACTLVDTCVNGACTGTPKPCEDDGNPCTTQTGCDQESGECLFQNMPDETVCDDGTVCTLEDTCMEGQCIGAELACDDDNPCTSDTCDPETGCVYQHADGPCEDGNPCTLDDGCLEGTCAPGALKNCDDDNVCTDNTCDSESGDCVATANNANCDDDEFCTVGDVCIEGVCTGETPEKEANVCDGLDEDCDGMTDEDCTLVLEPGIFTDGGNAKSTTPNFELEESLGAPRFVGETSTGDFMIVPGTSNLGGEKP